MKIKRLCEKCNKELTLDYDGFPIPEITIDLRDSGEISPAGYWIKGYLCNECGYGCRKLLMDWLEDGKKDKDSY